MDSLLIDEDWDVMVDLFFYKKVDEVVAALPETADKEEEDKVNHFRL